MAGMTPSLSVLYVLHFFFSFDPMFKFLVTTIGMQNDILRNRRLYNGGEREVSMEMHGKE